MDVAAPIEQVSTDVVLAEYRAMRAEVLQLNSQIIGIFTGTLALDISVLGWFFARAEPSKFYALPTVGVFFIALGSTILTNRLRLAHRLGMFQKYFLEPRLPGICWATVYFRYREQVGAAKSISTWGERLTESGFLLAVGIVNLAILLFIGLWPCWTVGTLGVDWLQVVNFLVAAGLLAGGGFLRGRLRDYSVLDGAMKRISEEAGLTGGSAGRPQAER